MVDIVRRRLLQGTALIGGLAATRSLFPAPAIAQIPKAPAKSSSMTAAGPGVKQSG